MKWKTAFGTQFLEMLGWGAGFWRLAEGNWAQVTSPGWAGILGIAGMGEFLSHTHISYMGSKLCALTSIHPEDFIHNTQTMTH